MNSDIKAIEPILTGDERELIVEPTISFSIAGSSSSKVGFPETGCLEELATGKSTRVPWKWAPDLPQVGCWGIAPQRRKGLVRCVPPACRGPYPKLNFVAW